MSEESKIDVLVDGPLIVDNLSKLTNSKGEEIEIDEKIALCVCGQSSNKPFCDGTHKKVGFSSERESNADLVTEKRYTGEKINVYDNRAVCCHAGECVTNLNSVFNVNSRPWINPDKAEVDEIIEVVKKCPSGALTYEIDDQHIKNFDFEDEINISKNGPYHVMGGIKLDVEHDLKPPSNSHYTLCRCGASKNKPYCDGSHSGINFIDEDN